MDNEVVHRGKPSNGPVAQESCLIPVQLVTATAARCRARRTSQRSPLTRHVIAVNVNRMASTAGTTNKRKSGEIFEVSEDDLSPEEVEDAEPAAKIAKTAEDCAALQPPNLKDAEPAKPAISEECTVISDDSEGESGEVQLVPESSEVFVVVDSLSEEWNQAPTCALPPGADEVLEIRDDAPNDSEVLGQEGLEEGELNEEPECLSKRLQVTVHFSDQAAAERHREAFLQFLAALPDLDVESFDDLTLNVYSLGGDNLPPSHRKRRHSAAQELFVVDPSPTVGLSRAPTMRYSTKFLIQDADLQGDQTGPKPGLGGTCFNCGAQHELRTCPHPKDYQTINANRQRFLSKNKTTRYHVSDATGTKYEHLRPGKLSLGARQALRLKKHQLPSFIYRMRRIGYPPGWLEEAKVGGCALEVFDIEGKNVRAANRSPVQGLDADQVVDYPGFNIPIEKPFKDEFKYYGVAPYSDKFHKRHMIAAFERPREDREAQDMDLDSQDEKETKAGAGACADIEPQHPVECPGLRNSVRESQFSTPILKSLCAFRRLPSMDNFTKGVSPVIDFENLPNSTGKYEQMSGVLKKVRDTLRNQTKPPT